MKKLILVVAIIATGMAAVVSCQKENVKEQSNVLKKNLSNRSTLDLKKIIKTSRNHSKCLEFFFQKAKENGMKLDSEKIGMDGFINDDYIKEVAISYPNESPVFFNIDEPTRRKSILYLNEIKPRFKKNEESAEALKEAIVNYIESNDFLKIDKDCREYVAYSLFIYLDSYDYWVNNFQKWVLEIYTPEARERLEKKWNVSFSNDRTSPGDRMVWQSCRSIKKSEYLQNIEDEDAIGFFLSCCGVGNAVSSAIASIKAIFD